MTPTTNLYESPALRAVTGPAIRPGGLALTERAQAFCRLARGAEVLDVGCGSGATVNHLRQCHGLRAVGLDLSWHLLAEGSGADGSPVTIQGRAEALPIGEGRLAAIFSECLLSLLADPATALAEWHRVLAPEGFLIVSDLYARSGRWVDGQTPPSVRCCLTGAVPREMLLDRLRAAGFTVLLWEDHTPLLKQLAARLVWAHGSLAAFWESVGAGCAVGQDSSGGKPGYYLMVARKGGADRG
ncbi:MAG: DVU_1556 family methyltransferase [Desulfatitalea sp.]